MSTDKEGEALAEEIIMENVNIFYLRGGVVWNTIYRLKEGGTNE